MVKELQTIDEPTPPTFARVAIIKVLKSKQKLNCNLNWKVGKTKYLFCEQKEAISLKFDLQGRFLNSAWKRSLKSVNAMGRSMASKTRKEEKVGSFVSNMDSAIDDLENGIRLENNDDLRRALDIFIGLREEMEVILGKQNQTLRAPAVMMTVMRPLMMIPIPMVWRKMMIRSQRK